MEKDKWWDVWPTAWTTDDEIEAIVNEEAEDIAKELLTHIRDTRREEGKETDVDAESAA